MTTPKNSDPKQQLLARIKRSIGRPPKYDPKKHPVEFVAAAAEGKCVAETCAEWLISRETVYAWKKTHPEFSDAFSRAKELREAYWMKMGKAIAMGKVKGNNGYVWWNLAKQVIPEWTDKFEHLVTDGFNEELEFGE